MFTSIVLAQARIGRQSAAWATAEELRGLELELFWHGSYHADRCLAKLAEYYASASRHDDARKTAERIRDASLRSEIEQSLSDGTKTGARGAASPRRAGRQARRLGIPSQADARPVGAEDARV